MAYKYVDPEKLEKRKRRSTKTSGVFSILIGILCLALGVVFFVALKSFGGMLFFLFLPWYSLGLGFTSSTRSNWRRSAFGIWMIPIAVRIKSASEHWKRNGKSMSERRSITAA